MDLNRLGNKRARRSRTWASVCLGLFGGRERASDETAGGDDPAGKDDPADAS